MWSARWHTCKLMQDEGIFFFLFDLLNKRAFLLYKCKNTVIYVFDHQKGKNNSESYKTV